MRILIVDDDATMRQALRLLLKKDGHDVSESGNPIQARQILDNRPFDLLLIDLNMPEMNGLEFIRDLRSGNCLIPAILITSEKLPDAAEGTTLFAVSKDLQVSQIIVKINQYMRQLLSN